MSAAGIVGGDDAASNGVRSQSDITGILNGVIINGSAVSDGVNIGKS